VRWAGSTLLCHAKCVFTADEGTALMRRFDADTRLTEVRLASDMGVPTSVIRAALYYARKRAGRKASYGGR
jgi:hypothetical protein